MTPTKFLQVILGCFLGVWEVKEFDTLRVVQWLAHLHRVLDDYSYSDFRKEEQRKFEIGASSWLSLLLSAAKSHVHPTEEVDRLNKKLMLLGRRYGKTFLSLPKHSFLGFVDNDIFVGIIRREEERIKYLRKVAREL